MEPPRIDVAWPDQGMVHARFAVSIAGTLRDMEYHGCAGKVFRSDAPFPRNRNIVVESFLAESDSEWLWLVDSDQMFSQGHPMQLLATAQEYEAKIVSGLAFIFKDGTQPVPSYFLKGVPPLDTSKLYLPNAIPDHPIPVEATGLATTLVHREVFETMTPAREEEFRWFDWISVPPMEEGHTAEDVSFFLRAQKLGFQAILDPAAWTVHLKEVGVGRGDWHRWMELHGGKE